MCNQNIEWWRLRLSNFDFDVLHRAGVKHRAADNLSWLPTDDTDNTLLEDELSILVIASGGRIANTITTIIALKAHTSMSAQFSTNADGTEATPPTLAELITV